MSAVIQPKRRMQRFIQILVVRFWCSFNYVHSTLCFHFLRTKPWVPLQRVWISTKSLVFFYKSASKLLDQNQCNSSTGFTWRWSFFRMKSASWIKSKKELHRARSTIWKKIQKIRAKKCAYACSVKRYIGNWATNAKFASYSLSLQRSLSYSPNS